MHVLLYTLPKSVILLPRQLGFEIAKVAGGCTPNGMYIYIER